MLANISFVFPFYSFVSCCYKSTVNTLHQNKYPIFRHSSHMLNENQVIDKFLAQYDSIKRVDAYNKIFNVYTSRPTHKQLSKHVFAVSTVYFPGFCKEMYEL